MTWTKPDNEYEALVYVCRRLEQHFPAVPEETIHALVVDELERYGSARLRQYIPMLVERELLASLRRDAASHRLAS
ncbi:MAG: hypothetical protein ABW024_07085 [Microbacterium sp.]